jgi:hypothetical protein
VLPPLCAPATTTAKGLRHGKVISGGMHGRVGSIGDGQPEFKKKKFKMKIYYLSLRRKGKSRLPGYQMARNPASLIYL